MAYTKRALAAVADRAVLWDDDVRGLGLRRVDTRRGTTWTWVVDYRTNGKRRRMVVGRYPAVGVEAARKLAKRRIGEAAHDRDPLAELRGTTVAQLLDQYEAHHKTRRHGRAPREDRDVARQLDLIRERWGTRRASAIRYTDAAALLADVRGPVAQNRMRATIRGVWNRGRAWGLIPANVANPAEGIPANRERPRTVRALSPAEVARVIKETIRSDYGMAGGVLVLVALTAARPSEIVALRWTDVDEQRGTLTLAGRSGVERKGGGVLELAITQPIAIVLQWARDQKLDGPRVFPGRGGRPLSSSTIRDAWLRIAAATKLPNGATVYDLRAAALTAIARAAGLKVAQQLAGHTDSRTTLRYVRPAAAARTGQEAWQQELGEPFADSE